MESEQVRESAEQERVGNENARKDTEAEVIESEALRKEAELSRVNAEDGRVTSENLRDEEYTRRMNNENEREQVEADRVASEDRRVSAEDVRVNNEDERVLAESGRVIAEDGRVLAESGRVIAEEGRDGRITNVETGLTDVEYEVRGIIQEKIDEIRRRASEEGKRVLYTSPDGLNNVESFVERIYNEIFTITEKESLDGTIVTIGEDSRIDDIEDMAKDTMKVVIHGDYWNASRPDALAVYWVGTVEPIRAKDNDIWIGGEE